MCVMVKPHEQAEHREIVSPFDVHKSLKIRLNHLLFLFNLPEISVWVVIEWLKKIWHVNSDTVVCNQPGLHTACWDGWRWEPSLWCVNKVEVKWIKLKKCAARKPKLGRRTNSGMFRDWAALMIWGWKLFNSDRFQTVACWDKYKHLCT